MEFHWLLKLRDKLQEECYTAQWLKNILQQSLRKVERNSTSYNASCDKKLHDFIIARHFTPCNFACNLCRNKIARQFAWCNLQTAEFLDFCVDNVHVQETHCIFHTVRKVIQIKVWNMCGLILVSMRSWL